MRLGYSLGPDLRQRLKYSFERTQIRNVDDQASIFIKEQEGNNTVSQVSHTTSYDQLDNRRQPSKGYAVSLTNDLAGLVVMLVIYALSLEQDTLFRYWKIKSIIS